MLITVSDGIWTGLPPVLLPTFVSLWLAISASFIFMIWDLYKSKHLRINPIYNFTENQNGMVKDWRTSKLGRWSLLVGNNLFRKRFGTDRMLIRCLRAIISVVCFLGMIALGYLVLVFWPTVQGDLDLETVQQWGLTQYDSGNVTMQVIFAIGPTFYTMKPPNIESFDFDIAWSPESQHVQCRREDDQYPRFICNVQSPFSESPPENLIVTINYTRALSQFSVSSLRTGVYVDLKAGAQEDPVTMEELFTTTSLPIQLYPGFHVFGTTSCSFRDTYATVSDKRLGIPHRNRRIVSNLQALLPDPDFINSNSDNVTTTLRLTYRGGSVTAQAGIVAQQDQSNDSVLGGFAFPGGIWTVIDAVFATIFGCSVLLVVFGIKPLSIYGLVHLFQNQRSLIDDRQTLSAKEQSLTIAMMREHLLDDDYGDTEAMGAGNGMSENMELVDGGIHLRHDSKVRLLPCRESLLHENSGDMEAGIVLRK